MVANVGKRYAKDNYKTAKHVIRRANVNNIDINQLRPTTIPLLRDSYIGIGCGDTRDVRGDLLFQTDGKCVDVGIKRAFLPLVILGIEVPAFESVFKLKGLMNDEGTIFAQSATELDSLFVRIHDNAYEELLGVVNGPPETLVSLAGDEEAVGIFASKCLSALSRRISPVIAQCA